MANIIGARRRQDTIKIRRIKVDWNRTAEDIAHGDDTQINSTNLPAFKGGTTMEDCLCLVGVVPQGEEFDLDEVETELLLGDFIPCDLPALGAVVEAITEGSKPEIDKLFLDGVHQIYALGANSQWEVEDVDHVVGYNLSPAGARYFVEKGEKLNEHDWVLCTKPS